MGNHREAFIVNASLQTLDGASLVLLPDLWMALPSLFFHELEKI